MRTTRPRINPVLQHSTATTESLRYVSPFSLDGSAACLSIDPRLSAKHWNTIISTAIGTFFCCLTTFPAAAWSNLSGVHSWWTLFALRNLIYLSIITLRVYTVDCLISDQGIDTTRVRWNGLQLDVRHLVQCFLDRPAVRHRGRDVSSVWCLAERGGGENGRHSDVLRRMALPDQRHVFLLRTHAPSHQQKGINSESSVLALFFTWVVFFINRKVNVYRDMTAVSVSFSHSCFIDTFLSFSTVRKPQTGVRVRVWDSWLAIRVRAIQVQTMWDSANC